MTEEIARDAEFAEKDQLIARLEEERERLIAEVRGLKQIAYERHEALRDRFAMAAINGILACTLDYIKESGAPGATAKTRCAYAWKIADEMLKQRGGEPT